MHWKQQKQKNQRTENRTGSATKPTRSGPFFSAG